MATRKSTEEVDEVEETAIQSTVYDPKIVTFTIIGTSPLLQNNPAEFVGKGEEETGLNKKKVYNDEDEARLRCYKDSDGRYGHPAQSFVKAMLRAATGKKFGKLSAPSLIRGGVFIVETLCLLEDEKGKPLAKYTIDRQPVVMPNKARVLRCRPSWMPWAVRVALEINVALISEVNVRSVLALAGPTVGIGDNRPEKSGRNGRYRLV